jgi:hypothetical protein
LHIASAALVVSVSAFDASLVASPPLTILRI